MTTLDSMTDGTTPWLDAEQQRSWRAFLGGTTVLNERLDRDLRTQHGLSLPEYEVLVRLSESPDSQVRMAELAAALAYSRSRITHTIARLERSDLVERVACDADGRGVSAALTDVGRKALEAAAHTHVRGVRDYFVAMTQDDELAIIGAVFERVRTALNGKSF